jgi:hypothetical protein
MKKVDFDLILAHTLKIIPDCLSVTASSVYSELSSNVDAVSSIRKPRICHAMVTETHEYGFFMYTVLKYKYISFEYTQKDKQKVT